MSNTQGKLNLVIFIVDEGNQQEALLQLTSLDNDYDEESASKIIKEACELHDDLEDIVEAIINHYDEESDTHFLLSNDSYCSKYEINIVRTDDNTQVVAIAYIT